MIFVTVGGQLPFDRLIRAVDRWASDDRRDDVFAQIGRTAFRPGSIRYTSFLVPSDFRRCLDEADYVISHAGIGTILSALERGKPLLVVPRQARFGESVNDHQVATARHFAERGMVAVAFLTKGACSPPNEKITSGLRRTISLAASCSRS